MSDSLSPEFMNRGACANLPPQRFFPDNGAEVEAAKKICAECVVKVPCLEYALENRIDHGVWGGESERERRRMIKSRKQTA